MNDFTSKVKIALVADRPDRANLIRDIFEQLGIPVDVCRLAPGNASLHRAKQTGAYRREPLPDFFIFDFTYPDEHTQSVLRAIAFGKHKSKSPVILLTSPASQKMLDAGEVDGGAAIMFSPTGLVSFARKLQDENRNRFLKALRTLYQFGPILVRLPQSVLCQDARELTKSA